LFPPGFSFVVFYAFLALGVGGGFAMAGGVAAAASVFPGRVGAIGGALTAGYAGGGLVQLPIVTQLSAAIGWLPALRAVAVASALIGALMLLLMPRLPAPAHVPVEERVTLGRLFSRRLVWTGFVIQALAASGRSCAVLSIA